MSKYLITGGAGFIGSNIADELVRRGHQVRVFDDLSTGKLSNLSAIENEIEFIKGDIRDKAALVKAFAGIDYVLHVAALRAVLRSVDDPEETNEVNVRGI